MITFEQTGASLLTNFMKLSLKFLVLLSTEGVLGRKTHGNRCGGQRDWLNGLAAEFYDEGIVKLLSRLDKCLNLYGDYVEK
jgi:hypothetical protein